MKKILSIATSLVMLFAFQAHAQTQPAGTPANTTQNTEPRTLADKQMSSRLQKDISNRNSSLGNTPVSWYDAGYGYYGTYSSDNQNHMVRYDRKGNYVETLTRKEWNDQIPAATRTSFDQSEYAGQTVTGYWETTDSGRKGSYYELSDATGKSSCVWTDGNGKFSNQPQGSNQPGGQRP